MAFSKITTRGMSGDTLEAGDIAANAVGASELADDAVDTAAIADNAVTNAKIPDDLIQVKPHIKPGTLYPAVHGVLENSTGLDFVDTGNTGHNIARTVQSKSYHVASVKKNGNSSIYFTGIARDDMTVADHADFNYGTGDFTYEFFVKAGDQDDTYATIVTDDSSTVRVGFGDSATNLKLGVYLSGPADIWIQGTSDMSDDTDWHHCVVLRQSGTIRLYVDGVQETTSTASNVNAARDCGKIRIGTYNGSTKRFRGYLDQLRISNNCRYPDGTTFTPPTAHFTSDANTKLLLQSNVSLPHSGAYGTAQSDGKKYYYTDIKGSKPIKDPRIGGHFGGQRHKVKSMQLLEQETAINGEDVFSIDGREWFRVTAPSNKFVSLNNLDGQRINFDSTYTNAEVVGYFSDFNVLYKTKANAEWRYSLDGATEVATSYGATSNTTPLAGRYVDCASILNIPISATLGIHTIKLRQHNTDLDFFGVELIAQDTGTDARRSQINIPAQNVVSYGKKVSIGSDTLTNSVHPHYNPFNGMSGAKTLTELGTYIDTATSLGMDNWKAGTSNYYKPFNGGRVVRWVDSSGAIKTSVTMMPPNAQKGVEGAEEGSASDAYSNAEVQAGTNNHTITFNKTAIDHSLSEVAKSHSIFEFGNGACNAGRNANFADATQLWTDEDDISFCMDDGLTSLVAHGVKSGTEPLMYRNDAASYYDHTFIGTGISLDIYW